MAFLSLKEIGKIYVGEGNVAVGIRGVNLDFDLGEFVAITGKSGSGKSTLLNVISGMDTYEEGEMLIEGEPTSHYLQQDFEEYREKYISFVFQDYNIIESFTVLQNVELALMHIKNRKERRARAKELIDRVGLSKHMHNKGSKLSGGQKQRTVIARALAKDSPIILADEPCGNLDSETSKEIIALLREVSKDKLLIMVTHNFEDVANVATREIRVFDGSIESDKILIPNTKITDRKQTSAIEVQKGGERLKSNIKDGIHLGRVTFFAKPKLSTFLCILMIIATLGVYFMTSISSMGIRSLFKKNTMFRHIDGRLVATFDDGRTVTEEEVKEIAQKYGAESYLKLDALFDATYNSIHYKDKKGDSCPVEVDFNFGKKYSGTLVGRYPEKINEALLFLPISRKGDFGTDELTVDKILASNHILYDLVGVVYYTNNTLSPECLLTEDGFRLASAKLNKGDFMTNHQNEYGEDLLGRVVPSFELKKGEIHFEGDSYDSWKKSGEKELFFNVIYQYRKYDPTNDNDESYADTHSYTEKNIVDDGDFTAPEEYIFGWKYENDYVFIDPETYIELYESTYNKFYSQFSLFFKNDREAAAAAELMRKDNFIAVPSNTEYEVESLEVLINLLSGAFTMIAWILAMLFISFFLNLCTSKIIISFKHDMAIMRSMGIPAKVVRFSMYGRMLFCLVPAFLVEILAGILTTFVPTLNSIFGYIYPLEYLIIFIGVIFISMRVTHKHLGKIFGESVKKSLKGGANS